MRKIEFEAQAGDEIWKVRVGQAAGAGDSWSVVVNNYYRGRIAFLHGEWVNLDRRIDTADFEVIVERIEDYLKNHEKQ